MPNTHQQDDLAVAVELESQRAQYVAPKRAREFTPHGARESHRQAINFIRTENVPLKTGLEDLFLRITSPGIRSLSVLHDMSADYYTLTAKLMDSVSESIAKVPDHATSFTTEEPIKRFDVRDFRDGQKMIGRILARLGVSTDTRLGKLDLYLSLQGFRTLYDLHGALHDQLALIETILLGAEEAIAAVQKSGS